MKWRIYGLISAAFILVLASSVSYLYYRHSEDLLAIGTQDLAQADGLLSSAVSMPILNVPNNTLSDRAIIVSSAAAFIQSADLCLRNNGVQHLFGISQVLSAFSYDLPFPGAFGQKKVQRQWQFIVLVEKGLNSCWDMHSSNPSLNLNRLHAVIADVYKEMPVTPAQRQAYYNASQL